MTLGGQPLTAIAKILTGAVAASGMTSFGQHQLGFEHNFVTRVTMICRTTIGEVSANPVRVRLESQPELRRIALVSGDVPPEDRDRVLTAARDVPGIADARWTRPDATVR